MKTSPAPAFFKFLHIILICGLLISQVAPAIASSTPNFASKTLSKAPAVKFSPSIHPAPTPHTEPADGTPDTKHNLLSALGNLGARTNTNPETGLLIFIGLDPQRPLSLSNLLSPGASPQQASQAFLLKYGTLFGIQDPDAQLVLQKTDQDGGGFQYFRYAQFFQHVPVFGGEMLVQIDSQNNFVSATGVVVPNLVNLNLTPRLNSEAAQNAARQALRAEIESAGKYSMTSDQLVPSTPQQVIFNPELLHAPGLPIPTLAWVVDVQSNLAGTPGEQIILDAQTGTVLMRSPLQQSANVFVYNNENKAEFFRLPNQTQVIRSDSTGSSKVSEVNFAYTTMRNILTFFQNQFQWTSADNHDMDIHVTVNYCPESSIADNDCPYPNAYWDPISHQFVFGQRNLTDDLMGHEFTHAVTSYANGLYYYGQSGSIHESLSDIFGEIYDQNNGIGNDAANVKWLIGEDRPKRYLLEDPVHRSMQDPPKYKQPDQITDTEYSCKAGFTATDDYGSVHHNNSILNKAAYLMSDGGNFNGQQVSAIGTDKTLQLIFQTELVLPMLADYNVLSSVLMQSCQSLIGQTPRSQSGSPITQNDCAQVQKAINAVEMPLPPCASVRPVPPQTLGPSGTVNTQDGRVVFSWVPVSQTDPIVAYHLLVVNSAQVVKGDFWLAGTLSSTAWFNPEKTQQNICNADICLAVMNNLPAGDYTWQVQTRTNTRSNWTTPIGFRLVKTSTGPTLDTLNPASVTASARGQILVVSGQNFQNNARLKWDRNGSVTYLSGQYQSSTALQFTIPDNLLATSGSAVVSVVNPDNQETGSKTFNINQLNQNNPVPSLSSVNPSSVIKGSGDLQIQAYGSSFVAAARLRWDGADLTTNYYDSGHLSAIIPAAKLTNSSTSQVTVFNPGPGGGISNSKPFTVSQPPTGCDYVDYFNLDPASRSGNDQVTIHYQVKNGFANFRASRVVSGGVVVTGESQDHNVTRTWDTTSFGDGQHTLVLEIDDTQGSPWDNPARCTSDYYLDPRPIIYPGNFSLALPGDGSSTNAGFMVDFSWEASSGATAYNIRLWNSTGYNTESGYQAGTTWSFVPPEAGSYQWQVTATNQYNRVTSSTDIHSLTINPAASVPTYRMVPSAGSFKAGDHIRINIELDPAGMEYWIEGSQVYITFDNTLLKLVGATPQSGTKTLQYDRSVEFFYNYADNCSTQPRLMGQLDFVAIAGGTTQVFFGTQQGSSQSWKWTDMFDCAYIKKQMLKAAINANFTIDGPPPNNPIPQISTFYPTSLVSGMPNPTLQVNGAGFVRTSVVFWNDTELATQFLNNGQLGVQIPPSLIATPGAAVLYVRSPGPGGGLSNSAIFNVTPPPDNVAPVIHWQQPAADKAMTVVNGGVVHLQVSAQDNIGVARVVFKRWDAPNLRSLEINQDAANPYEFDFSTAVLNPGWNQLSACAQDGAANESCEYIWLNYSPNNPAPVLDYLSNIVTNAGQGDLELHLFGSNFITASVVRFNGQDKPTTLISITELKTLISAYDLALPQVASLTVWNPSPGGGESTPQSFTIKSGQPTLNAIQPTSTLRGSGELELTITGVGFMPGATVFWDGLPLSTTYHSKTLLWAFIPPAYLASAGTAQVTVSNPAPGGGDSAGPTFTVLNPQPVVLSLDPVSTPVGSNDVVINLHGTDFVNGAAAYWNGQKQMTLFFSDTYLQTIIFDQDLASAGTAQITVKNPEPAAADSDPHEFYVLAPLDSTPPSVQWIQPVNDLGLAYCKNEVVTLEVNAQDNIGVEGVQFYYNNLAGGQNIDAGSKFTPPYTMDLDCTNLLPGDYQIHAYAWDAVGNSAEGIIYIQREAPLPDLQPFAPDGYAAPLVVSQVSGTYTGSVLVAGNPTYLDWHFTNSGDGTAAGSYFVDLAIDGNRVIHYPYSDSPPGFSTGFDDWLETIYEPGWHTLSLVTDSENSVSEYDETNNLFQKDYFWHPTVPFFDDFEKDSYGWTTSGLWHKIDASSPYWESQSGKSYWYGQEGSGDYQTVLNNEGSLVSPSIFLPYLDAETGDHDYLNFDYWYETESMTQYFDHRRVQISVDGGPFNTVLELFADDMRTWHQSPSILLDNYAGHFIQVKFWFDTVDQDANNYRGWYIDNFSISSSKTLSTLCFDQAGEPNGLPANATPIGLNQSYTGTICPQGDLDVYTFNANQGEMLVIDVNAATIGSALDAYLTLIGADGYTVLGTQDNDALSTDPKLGFVAPYSGSYYVQLRDRRHPAVGGNAFTYQISVYSDTQAPEQVEITSPISQAWINPQMQTISVTASDSGSGVARVEFFAHSSDWQNGEWVWLGDDRNGSDGWTFDLVTTDWPEQVGAAIYVFAYDYAGNYTGAASWDLGLDNTNPTNTLQFFTPYGSAPFREFYLSWQGEDLVSGLASFDIQVYSLVDQQWHDYYMNAQSQSMKILGFTGDTYFFRVRARDQAGNLSPYYGTNGEFQYTVQACAAPADIYEPDDQVIQANFVPANGIPQAHNIHVEGDLDWSQFNAMANHLYALTAEATGQHADTLLSLYAADGNTLIDWNDDYPGLNFGSRLVWKADSSGTYFTSVRHFDAYGVGCTTGYNLSVADITPQLTELQPAKAAAGSPGFSLALSGFYFPADSVVRWNNLDLATQYADEFHLTAEVPGNFLETTGTVQLTVFSPTYGNLEINSLPFEVVTLIQYPLFIPLVRR